MSDIRIASERAKFGELFVLRGLCTDVAGIGRLAQRRRARHRGPPAVHGRRHRRRDGASASGSSPRSSPTTSCCRRRSRWRRRSPPRPPLAVAKIKEGLRRALDPDWTELGDLGLDVADASCSAPRTTARACGRSSRSANPSSSAADRPTPIATGGTRCRTSTRRRASSCSPTCKSFMDDHIYPNEAEYHEQYESLGHDGRPADPREAEGRGPRARAVEPVPAAPRAGRAGHEAVQPRLLADLRGAGQGRVRLGGAELRGARHRATWRSSTPTGPRPSSATGWRRCWRARSARRSR